jgi:transcriptional regulator with XRE-family HTH domain
MLSPEQKIAIGLRLAEERKRLDLRRASLARLIGCTPLSLANAEDGKSVLGGDFIAALIECGVDINYVLSGSRDSSAGAQRKVFQSAFLEVSRQLKLSNKPIGEKDHLEKAWVLFDALSSSKSHVKFLPAEVGISLDPI